MSHELSDARLLNGTLLVEPLEETTAGGLITATRSDRKKGRVAKVGPGDVAPAARNGNDRIPVPVVPGDVVYYQPQDYHADVTLGGTRYLILTTADLHIALVGES